MGWRCLAAPNAEIGPPARLYHGTNRGSHDHQGSEPAAVLRCLPLPRPAPGRRARRRAPRHTLGARRDDARTAAARPAGTAAAGVLAAHARLPRTLRRPMPPREGGTAV